ncbi:hypothetical protein ONS95_005219 [Cadophora gregata]|uniref:uncharacterized protein n=1 Tax=Cadophora gregata TaxID=51156 RepID=UPI0026DD686F|nr:uncharacterized protein ONS95_005219 [Cadophora gregata]KAK0104958.1 hypothetical protein ONS95_005219 [Cadophora gregata]
MSAICRILATYNATRPSTPKMDATRKITTARLCRLRDPVFLMFPKLPAELRYMIFEIAANSVAFARLMIYVEVEVRYRKSKQRCHLIFKVLNSWDKKLDNAVCNLALSKASHEARVRDNSTSLLRLSSLDVLYTSNLSDFISKIYNSRSYPDYPFLQASVRAYFDNLQHLAIPYDYLCPSDPRTKNPAWSNIKSSFACFPNLKQLDLINEAGHSIHSQIGKKYRVLEWMEGYRGKYATDYRKQRLGDSCSHGEIDEELASEDWAAFTAKTYPERRVQIRNWRGKIRLPPALPGEVMTDEGIVSR